MRPRTSLSSLAPYVRVNGGVCPGSVLSSFAAAMQAGGAPFFYFERGALPRALRARRHIARFTIMPSSSQKPPVNDQNEDTSTPLAFYIFMGALGAAVLGFLWMLFQMTF